MSSAVAFQMKGLGSLPVLGPYGDGGSEVGDAGERAAAQALSVSSLSHRSIRFSHELEVGVECRCQRARARRGWASHVLISGALCADRLSRITWTASSVGTVAS